MKNFQRNRDEAGMALIVATIFMSVAILVLSALGLRAIKGSHQTDQYQNYVECWYGVEAGMNECWVEIENNDDAMVGLGTWTEPAGATGFVMPEMDDEGIDPQTMASLPRVQYLALAQDWSNDNVDNNGDGTVDGPEEAFWYTIHSRSQLAGVQRGAEVIVRGEDVNVWNNAIFAGSGQAGGLINGNVSIHGSVHLLGTNLLTGTTALAALDLSGTSLIHNNYEGLNAGLRARVPALPQTTFDGETVDTLDAKLRVRNGLVGLSGNSEVGEPHQTGNAWKETMDGTYVEDGWTGNSVVDDGDRGDPSSVWSDNGWDESYDLGTRVPMPILNDEWRDPTTGDPVPNPSTGANYTHTEYFNEQLTGSAYSGDVLIRANQDFYYNASRPTDPDPANRQPTDDYILFDSSSDNMEINGQITIDGNLTMTRGSGNDKTINYTGRAAILVNGNVTLDTNLYSQNADGTTANSFPENNFLGIMAEQNMIVGSLSQLEIMGGFYAQNTIQTSKQTTVMGTFVASYFDMGTNVPDIYQVPALSDNLPLGMIGAYPILVFSQVSFREVGV